MGSGILFLMVLLKEKAGEIPQDFYKYFYKYLGVTNMLEHIFSDFFFCGRNEMLKACEQEGHQVLL